MYVKKSLGRPGGGAGNPSPKHPTVILIDVDDIKAFPPRTVGTTTVAEGLELKDGAEAIGIYATPGSIEVIQEAGGEADARGYLKGVKFDHPGNSSESEDFVEAYSNVNVVAVVRGCDGGAARIAGSPCNPLSMVVETTDTKEANKKTMTFKQEVRDVFRIMFYTGDLPEVEGAVAGGEGE